MGLSVLEFRGTLSQLCSYGSVMRNLLVLPSRRNVMAVVECCEVVIAMASAVS